MRYATLSTKAALALALPFILAHCASLLSERLPLTYDAKSVGGPNSSAPLQLYLPPGNGPFPTLLVMHGCGGILDNHRSRAGRLVGWGYAAVIVDSFRPRNHTQDLRERRNSIPTSVRGLDAHNAAIYLRTLPNIQADRIGHRWASLTVAGRPFMPRSTNASLVDRGGRPFQAAVAYYPPCSGGKILEPFATDLLILFGRATLCRTPSAPASRLRGGPIKPVRPPSRSIPVRCTTSTVAACPRSTSSGHMIGAIPKRQPTRSLTDEGFPRCAAQGEVAERTRVHAREFSKLSPCHRKRRSAKSLTDWYSECRHRTLQPGEAIK